MTLGDTINGLTMLKLYRAALDNPARKINYNLLITGVGVASGFVVGVLGVSTLVAEQTGVASTLFATIAALNTEYAGFLLAALFLVIGVSAWLLWRPKPTG